MLSLLEIVFGVTMTMATAAFGLGVYKEARKDMDSLNQIRKTEKTSNTSSVRHSHKRTSKTAVTQQ